MVRVYAARTLKVATVTFAVSVQLTKPPPSKTAISPVVGNEAGAPDPEDVPQFTLLFQAVELPPIQYRVAASRLKEEKQMLRKRM